MAGETSASRAWPSLLHAARIVSIRHSTSPNEGCPSDTNVPTPLGWLSDRHDAEGAEEKALLSS